jgi:hypothetical protein
VAAVGLAAAAVGWVVYTQAFGQSDERPLSWSDLTAKLGRVEFPRPTGRIYLSRGALAAYLRAVMPGRAPAPPPIDFRRREALLLAVGPRSSTGYDLRILRVTERRKSILVVARERTPALGDPVTARLTYPYRLITFPRSSKTVYIEMQGRP